MVYKSLAFYGGLSTHPNDSPLVQKVWETSWPSFIQSYIRKISPRQAKGVSPTHLRKWMRVQLIYCVLHRNRGWVVRRDETSNTDTYLKTSDLVAYLKSSVARARLPPIDPQAQEFDVALSVDFILAHVCTVVLFLWYSFLKISLDCDQIQQDHPQCRLTNIPQLQFTDLRRLLRRHSQRYGRSYADACWYG